MTSKSLSEQLAEITNPVPTSHDPEDDVYEETRAQVTERDWQGGLSGDEESAPSRLRQRAAALLPDLDPRYAGRAVSRKNLLHTSDGEDSLDDSGASDGASDATAEDGEEDAASEEEEDDEDQLEAFKAKLNGVGADTNGLSPNDEAETDSEEAADQDSSVSAEDPDREDSGQEDDVEDDDEEEDDGDEDGEDISAALDGEDAGGVDLTSQTCGSDAQKGAAVKAQLNIWDQLLECRIKLQPCMQLCGQLPAPGAEWQMFWSAADPATAARLAEAATAADTLLKQLLQLQDTLTAQYPETRRLAPGAAADSDSEHDSDSDAVGESAAAAGGRRARKRRRAGAAAADPAKRFAAYRPYRDQTIQRWNDKTRLTAGRAAAKSFAAFEQSTLKQIEQILSDRERLLRRTRLRRSDAVPLGRPEHTEPSVADEKREYDEIFDDSDFYHQLLRELIERKTVDVTDPLALGRQWIQIQKLRSKLKKRVDTRASKGRKVRYEVYPKLVNFMASERAGTMSEAARDELFASLFGSRCQQVAGDSGAAWTGLNGNDGVTVAGVNGGPAV